MVRCAFCVYALGVCRMALVELCRRKGSSSSSKRALARARGRETDDGRGKNSQSLTVLREEESAERALVSFIQPV